MKGEVEAIQADDSGEYSTLEYRLADEITALRAEVIKTRSAFEIVDQQRRQQRDRAIELTDSNKRLRAELAERAIT